MGSTAALASALSNTAGTTSTSNSQNALNSLGTNFNEFLSLLTTQLENQDPTNPVDSNQFTQQLVEFAGVQQQVQSNQYLQQMVSALQGTEISSASSYVGTTIQATGDQTALTNGSATIAYNLSAQATNVNVTITDSSGNEVFSGSGTTNAGTNELSWNGVNSFTGATEPDGVYNVKVTAADSSGNTSTITVTPFITGTVSSASISNGTVELNIGALQVPVTSVTNVSNLGSSGSASAGTNASTTGSS